MSPSHTKSLKGLKSLMKCEEKYEVVIHGQLVLSVGKRVVIEANSEEKPVEPCGMLQGYISISHDSILEYLNMAKPEDGAVVRAGVGFSTLKTLCEFLGNWTEKETKAAGVGFSDCILQLGTAVCDTAAECAAQHLEAKQKQN